MIKRYLLLLTLPFSLATAGQPQHQASLISVEDGDTLVVKIKGEEKRVQLLGIDAPEDVENPKFTKDLQRTALDKQALLKIGQMATTHLKELVTPGEKLTLEADLTKKDRYGRLSATVFRSDNRSLNQTMVEEGYAVVLGRYPLDPSLKQSLKSAEQEASEEARGLWGSAAETTRAWHGQSQ
ncbi:MAG: thermonuclease family protein [Candidatus Sedimenticola sp. (ex Thyasira tokunagai)]